MPRLKDAISLTVGQRHAAVTSEEKPIQLPQCFDMLSNLVTALHPQNVGLSYRGSRLSPTAAKTAVPVVGLVGLPWLPRSIY